MIHWFAVLTKPRAEHVAREHLERQGFECRLPRLRRHQRRAGGMVDRIEPLFPRYLFLRADPEGQNLATVRSTRGVCGLVRFGDSPARVPESVIESIAQRTDASTGFVRLDPPPLEPGARVRVTDGPFAGVEAVFRERSASSRALLLVRLLGEWCSVKVPIEHLALRL